jgi:hypothetical protein
MSQDQITYNFDYQFSREEMAYIRRGVIPEQMEDKWFIYFEDDVLYFHRSWTGVAIYEVHFEETRVKKIRICRDKKFYTETDDQYDIAMVKFMIDCFLLKKSSPYPRRKGEGDEEHALGMWSNMGRAMMKKE